MTTQRIFVSYASDDLLHDSDVKLFDTFRDDLINEIALRGWPARDLAFCAKASIRAGTSWPAELEHALRTTQVMLCCYSFNYFISDWCGREFTVFMDRRDRWLQTQPAGAAVGATRIIPVIWIPKKHVPDRASLVQDRDDAYPPDYWKLGIRQLMLLHREPEYRLVLTALAERVVGALDEPAMPPAGPLGNMEAIVNAFEKQPAATSSGGGAVRSAEDAYFVYAAANRDQLQGKKQQLDAWGTRNGWDWRPYFPTTTQSVGALAQFVAGKKNLRYQELACDGSLPQRLREAKSVNAPVVIITDPWTATLPAYRPVLQEYDLLNLTNCALLVPWNELDTETVHQKSQLERNLRTVCEQKYRDQYPAHYWQIRTHEELSDRALGVLDEITLRVLAQADPGELRKAESAELTSAAAAEGIPIAAPSQLVNVAPTPPPVESEPLTKELP